MVFSEASIRWWATAATSRLCASWAHLGIANTMRWICLMCRVVRVLEARQATGLFYINQSIEVRIDERAENHWYQGSSPGTPAPRQDLRVPGVLRVLCGLATHYARFPARTEGLSFSTCNV
jgi:hypothetical protein